LSLQRCWDRVGTRLDFVGSAAGGEVAQKVDILEAPGSAMDKV
jgi:hypothetical protein